MNRKEIAIELFDGQRYHCSQAVFASFADVVGIDQKEALKLGSCFGGGMRLGEMCGCVTGALMFLGLYYGDDRALADNKGLEFIKRFKEKTGAFLCKDLLKKDFSIREEAVEIKEKKIARKLCPDYVLCAVEILEEMINEGN